MEKNLEFECPYYHITIGEDECLDRYLIACGLFKDDNVVKEKDVAELLVMCEKCKRHGC